MTYHFAYQKQNPGLVLMCVQEAAINVFSTIKKYLNDDTMTKLLLPKAKSLFTKSSAVRVSIHRETANYRGKWQMKSTKSKDIDTLDFQ